jgi:hypothetical protein
MRLSRVIDEASVELATVESIVGTARHVLDVATETERVGHRIAARMRTIAIVLAVVGVTVGVAYGVKVVLDGRRSDGPAGPFADEALTDDFA